MRKFNEAFEDVPWDVTGGLLVAVDILLVRGTEEFPDEVVERLRKVARRKESQVIGEFASESN